MGSMCLTGSVQLQMPVVERACEVTRGADRAEMLRFASQFMEFGGWLFQDAGDLTCAIHWTDRALDYALELGDQRVVAYTLMRKAMITTEAGNPAQSLGIANTVLEHKDALTPRLRAVVTRRCSSWEQSRRDIPRVGARPPLRPGRRTVADGASSLSWLGRALLRWRKVVQL